MRQARRASAIIWSTVVYAGAMLGTTACKGGAAPTTPAPVAAAPAAPAPAEPAAPAEPPAPPPVVVVEAKPEPPPEPAPEPPPAAVPELVTVTVTSKPSGATVHVGDQLVGKTPLKYQVPRGDGPVAFRVTRKGYAEKVIVMRPEADAALAVVLAKPRPRPRGVGSVGTFGHGSGTGSPPSTGRGFILS